jgi:hypothetical protein
LFVVSAALVGGTVYFVWYLLANYYLMLRLGVLPKVADPVAAETRSTALASNGPERPLGRSEVSPFLRWSFGRMVLWGALFGCGLGLETVKRLEVIEAFRTLGALIAGLFAGVTVGALAGAMARAYRVEKPLALLAWFYGLSACLSLVERRDWAPLRSWGWDWVAVSLALLALEIMASILLRLSWSRSTPERVTRMLRHTIGFPMRIMSAFGAVVSCTVFVGLIGQLLDEHHGLAIGEAVGGLLGCTLVTLTADRLFAIDLHRRSLNVFGFSFWISLIVLFVLTDGGVLWVLCSDRPARPASQAPSSAQSRDGPASLGNNGLRSALQVGPLRVEVDAQVAIDRGRQIGGCHAGFLHLRALGVGAADDLAVGDAAAAQQHRHAVGPVFATTLPPLGEDRRPAELSHGQHQRVVQHAAIVEIVDEGDKM